MASFDFAQNDANESVDVVSIRQFVTGVLVRGRTWIPITRNLSFSI